MSWAGQRAAAGSSSAAAALSVTVMARSDSSQIAVGGSLYIVAKNLIGLATTDALGLAVFYVLTALLFLIGFAGTMLRKKVRAASRPAGCPG